MTDPSSTQNLEEIGTAAHLMMEAVDRASQELEGAVKASGDHLQSFNQTLTNNFVNKLTKLANRTLRNVDKNSEELSARKEDFAERLIELEQTEIGSLVRASKEVRQELELSLQQVVKVVSELVEEQAKTLRPLVLSQHENFSNLAKNETEKSLQFIEDSKSSLGAKETTLEKELLKQAQDFEQSIRSMLNNTRQKLSARIKANQDKLAEQVSEAQKDLNQFIASTDVEVGQKAEAAGISISSSAKNLTERLVADVDDWQLQMNHLSQNFEELLGGERDSFDQIHRTKIERQVQEVREEIETIASEAQNRLSASHKLFHLSLKRLERKYQERLEQLYSQFEDAISQEHRLMAGMNTVKPDEPAQTSHELKELLNTRLKARGLEIVKAFKRQVELFDLEHARFAASCNERIETVYSSAKDFLDQQLKTINTEVERTSRGFRVELAQLNLQLPQIKDAGHAAAIAVMAYKRARLSFGSD
jgi:hypothetical protein